MNKTKCLQNSSAMNDYIQNFPNKNMVMIFFKRVEVSKRTTSKNDPLVYDESLIFEIPTPL